MTSTFSKFYTGKDIDATAKWLADQTTKAVHRTATHPGPVWAKGNWRSFIYEESIWQTVHTYIQRHNTRRGLPLNALAAISDRAVHHPASNSTPSEWSIPHR